MTIQWVLGKWERFSHGIKPPNYIGDIFSTLHPNPNLGLGTFKLWKKLGRF
jgi:hypothetical protein